MKSRFSCAGRFSKVPYLSLCSVKNRSLLYIAYSVHIRVLVQIVFRVPASCPQLVLPSRTPSSQRRELSCQRYLDMHYVDAQDDREKMMFVHSVLRQEVHSSTALAKVYGLQSLFWIQRAAIRMVKLLKYGALDVRVLKWGRNGSCQQFSRCGRRANR